MNTAPDKRIRPFVDEDGNVTQLPAKGEKKQLVLEYLAGYFVAGRDYTEKEVNALLDQRHTFGDYFILRRSLVDAGLLCRTADGTRYWRAEQTSLQ